MVQSKTTTIIRYNFVKSGMNGPKSWDLGNIWDTDNQKYTVFQREPWESFSKTGQQVTIHWEEKKNGNFINKTIVDPPKNRTAQSSTELSKNQGTWDKIEKMIKALEDRVEELEFFTGKKLAEGEIKPEDIPF